MYCPRCGTGQADDHRFCFLCGAALPRDSAEATGRTPKVTDLFLGMATHPTDQPDPVLRVSHYREEITFAADEGSVSVPGHHVRVSIWLVDRPVCAMSLSESEARRLGEFLVTSIEQQETRPTSTGPALEH